MNEFWNSVVSGVVSGVAGAAVWAAALWAANLIRNAIVERKIRKALSRIGTSYGDEGFGVSLNNKTDVPLVVRDVVLNTTLADEGIGLLFKEPSASFLITEKKTKKPMHFKTKTLSKRKDPVFTSHGFVELPPYTGGVWQLVPRFFLENADLIPTSCRATIEYRTLLGNPRLIIVSSNQQSAGLIRDDYSRFLDYIRKKKEVEPTGADALRA